MNYADFFTQPNGFPLESDSTLGFMQTDYQSALKGLAAYFGSGVIISGMAETPSTVSDGWIYLNGDLVFFQGGVKTSTFIVEETWVQKANQNGALVNRYKTKVAKFGSGGTSYLFGDLQRLESLQSLQNRILDTVLQESEVVVSGCVVSSVNTGASTLAISAGVLAINRKFISMPAYAGGYPVYANEAGQWVNSPPASNFIAFSPYTSQRFADVLSRVGTPAGEIRMRAALTDRFDGSGLGRFELKGWAICNGANGTMDLRSRFPVAYDPRNSDPGGNFWDAANNTPGNTGGEKRHTLTVSEMPEHRHTSDSIAEGDQGMIRRSVAGQSTTATAHDSGGSGTEPDIKSVPGPMSLAGGGQSHENRPPFVVLVFIQRI